MKPKKIGLLALALVLALGTLGVGYAAWTDTITIDGTVETGSLDINVEYFSGTIIYKDLADDSLVSYFWLKDAGGVIKWYSGVPYDSNNTNHVFVASAASTPNGDDSIKVDFVDAFPSTSLCADFIVHCVGTVPVHVYADIDIDDVTDDAMLKWLYDNGYVTLYARWVEITDNGTFTYTQGDLVTELPVQMHNCEYIKVWLYLDLPQVDDADMRAAGYFQEDFMNQNWDFTATIFGIQWNETP